MGRPPRVFTIPSDAPFLEVLARAVLKGFPSEAASAPSPFDIARVTILVPTRRAARDLERIFFEVNDGNSLLLPRISPIGDIDEELSEPPEFLRSVIDAALPGAISPIGRDLILMDLIGEWARINPQERLAKEIVSSPRQMVTLAVSLAEFLDSLETEDIDPARIADLYGIESARHREAILGFLALIREKLPARLLEKHLLGPKARRSLLLRREAILLAENQTPWPIIAAGSTGSIPAARELLGTIAGLPNGAVVLPGLDTHMDEESWLELGAQHPQFILKQFLAEIAVARDEVALMPGCPTGWRSWLASEIMRPTATSEKWRSIVCTQRESISRALEKLEVVDAHHVPEEATAIALILRSVLETPGKTASLITADRELARRVKQQLANWGIDVDDSAGEPLIRFGGATFLSLLIDVIVGGCEPGILLTFFKHHLCRLGFDRDAAYGAVDVIELTVFRGCFIAPPLAELANAVRNARKAVELDPHIHPAIKRKTEADWMAAASYADKASACLMPLMEIGEQGLGTHLEMLVRCCELAAGSIFWDGEEGETLRALVDDLKREAGTLATCSFATAATLLKYYMSVTPFRRKSRPQGRLAILGLIEARLTRPDVVILGGLNEGRWPAAPDPGPWLNRPMREALGMQQPERDIGQTAHDFAQALGCKEVYLTWSRRVGDAPAIQSRWILRLQTLVKAAGFTHWFESSRKWQSLAARFDDPIVVRPCERPKPCPPKNARPKHMSVTRVETLIRDPYAFYVNQVLGLRPLDEISVAPDMAQRGMLFHQIIADFLKTFPESLPSESSEYLLRRGLHHFSPLISHPEAGIFWWPQFERIAEWLVTEETKQRQSVSRVYSEIDGRLEFPIAGQPFTLICRADRIDILADGDARIIDYKTGAVPSGPQVAAGLAPQLTLQSAILEAGGYPTLGKLQSREIAYVKLSGGDPAGEVIIPKLKQPVMDCARRQLSGLISLLTAYQDQQQAYLPRAMVEKEDEEREFDHLSRYREWSVSGEAA
ncbi:MAG: double-strand break repair protein AddB [Rhizobiales bacterium]|nr:double-strand break repair protein AddB [Hyphomicrobiales bacterium]